MKLFKLLLGSIIGIGLLLYGLFVISKSRSFQFFGEIYPHIETDKKVVALTFDDAPTTQVAEVLNILLDQHIKATFYMVGKAIEDQPEIAQAIITAGHEAGNHSYTHQRFLLKTPSFVGYEVETTNRLISNAGYAGEITFRPPNGKKLFTLPWYLHTHNMRTITWDIEPDTFATMAEGAEKTTFLVNHVLERVKPGSIILMHPLCKTCVSDRAALPLIIQGLKERGYLFLTVTELLALKG